MRFAALRPSRSGSELGVPSRLLRVQVERILIVQARVSSPNGRPSPAACLSSSDWRKLQGEAAQWPRRPLTVPLKFL
jgi:hypothetical protein